MKSLRLEALPSVTLRPAPGRRPVARSALALALAAHAALGIVLCGIVVPGTGKHSAAAPVALRLVGPSSPPRPDDSLLPGGTRETPSLPLLTRPVPVVPVMPTLPEIAIAPTPPPLDPSAFGDPSSLAPPPAPNVPKSPKAPRLPTPRADAPPRERPAAGSVASAAIPRSTPQPAYPARAIREARAGTARVRLEVNAGGRVSASALAGSSGHPDLDAAALRATARWRFDPARTAAGTPVASRVVVPVVFALR